MKRLDAAQVQHKFDPQKVLYLTGDVNYCTLYLIDGKSILSSRTLKWYSERWPQFMRIHKAHLINPEHIYSCTISTSIVANLVMCNGARLPIGRRRISGIIGQLGIYIPKYCATSTHLIKPERNSFVPLHLLAA